MDNSKDKYEVYPYTQPTEPGVKHPPCNYTADCRVRFLGQCFGQPIGCDKYPKAPITSLK